MEQRTKAVNHPESLHQVLIHISDRGTAFSYRNMHGYGSHTFSFLNNSDERVWVKFHFKTAQGKILPAKKRMK